VASYVYEGFGKIVGQNGGGGGPYQFCGLWGYRNDNDAGLLHVGARYYEVEISRFISFDAWLGAIFNPQTLNRFSYVCNNPISFIDSSGFKTEVPKWVEGVGIIITIIGIAVEVNNPGVGAGIAIVGTFLWGLEGLIALCEAISSIIESAPKYQYTPFDVYVSPIPIKYGVMLIQQ
jgi:RHS repeat-associated protein